MCEIKGIPVLTLGLSLFQRPHLSLQWCVCVCVCVCVCAEMETVRMTDILIESDNTVRLGATGRV